MRRKRLGWLIALLLSAPVLYAACGGDDSSTTAGAGGAAGAGTSTGGSGPTTGSGGAAGSGGAGGASGSAGAAGSAGKGGGLTDGGGSSDARTPCGMSPIGCTANQICDPTNSRCVQCLMDSDCASQATNKVCDTRPNMFTMLPADRCVECLTDANCPAGTTCNTTSSTCVAPCGTTTCATSGMGNTVCDAPNNRCVQCLTNSDCATQTTNHTCDTR